MSMDLRDQFPVDMVEQMLKFTPTPEERALLDEHADDIDHLARADRQEGRDSVDTLNSEAQYRAQNYYFPWVA